MNKLPLRFRSAKILTLLLWNPFIGNNLKIESAIVNVIRIYLIH